jgi:hypothetical protein
VFRAAHVGRFDFVSNCFDPSARVFGFEHLHGLSRHDSRYRMLVNKLGMSVPAKKNAEIVERRDNAGQLDAVDQEDRQRNFLLSDCIEKQVLEVLRTFRHSAPLLSYVPAFMTPLGLK